MKSLFKFSKQERKGIFFLLVMIGILQVVLLFQNSKTTINNFTANSLELFQLEKEIETLKLAKATTNKPKMYSFNPNFITDYKGYMLGLKMEEIDRLLNYRAKGEWIKSVSHFQQITKVSDSVLVKIAPYFKFPKRKIAFKKRKTNTFANNKTAKKIDLNSATLQQLKSVYGIGTLTAQRIIEYRTKNHGFISVAELSEVYGVKQDVIKAATRIFKVKAPRDVAKVKLNSATSDELVTIKYIDYEVAYQIIEYRKLHKGFKTINDLLKVKEFPVEKYDIIKLYLQLN